MNYFKTLLFSGGLAVLSLGASLQASSLPSIENLDSSRVRTAAAQVSCENITWTHGEALGRNDNRMIYTVIVDNRVYISRDEADGTHNLANISEVPAMLFHLDNNRFPIEQYQNQIDKCINRLDPSTMNPRLLGNVTNEGIYCDGILIKQDQLLGDYIGGDGVHTQQWTSTNDGILRISAFRNSGGNVWQPNSTSYNASLISAVFNGENGSYFNWNTLGYTLSEYQFDRCFYKATPKYGTIISNNDCGSSPELGTISEITNTSLNFAYSGGSGITSFNWKIKSNGSEIRSGQTSQINGNVGSIAFTSLVAGSYTLEIDGSNCNSSVSSKGFSITTSPIPGDCGRGPSIVAITNVTATSLKLQFDGDGVPNIDWRVKSGSNEVASGRTAQLTSNLVDIAFGSLSNGVYTLEIEVLGIISAITNTSLNFAYTGGIGITSFNWKVKSNGSEVRSGQTSQIIGNVGSISFSTLPAGAYTFEIAGSNCNSSVSSGAFTINTNPPLADCGRGPTIEAITNITATSLRFRFDGDGVSNIDWKIKSGSTELSSGRTSQLTSNLVDISFGALSNGDYNLEIQGGDCNSAVNSLSFTVYVDPCASAPSVVSVTNVLDSRLTVNLNQTYTGTMSWYIEDNSKKVAYGSNEVSNSNSLIINFNVLPIGQYTLTAYTPGCSNTRVAASETDFNITSVTNRDACTAGPNLVRIVSDSPTSIKFNFFGENVPSIDWKVIENKSGGQVIYQNRVYLQNDTPEVFFPETLPAGSYKLQIEGGDCSSTPQSMAFGPNPLPIHISTFSGKVIATGIQLEWTVLDEKNGSGFEIMRMNASSKVMESIGLVSLTEKKLGAYSFTDNAPYGGNNYYQLKQIDLDGTYVESRIINVSYDQITDLVVSPNPSSSVVNLYFNAINSGVAEIETISQSGIRVFKSETPVVYGRNKIPVNIERLPEGSYLIRLSYENKNKVFRFVKMN